MLAVSLGVSLALVSLLAGVHLTGQFILNPPLRELEYEPYLTMKRLIDRDAPRLAKPLMLVSLLSTAVSVVVALAGGGAVTVVATAVALSALVITLMATVRGDLPINRAMARWEPSTPPQDWQQTRSRWEKFFLIRVITTSLAVCAILAGFIAAASR
ncbi:anthrone oxygenase family protein [Microbacterium sp. P01]|uniref:anthrone oxygenase family protein n=1 Tax=unclassified Microbacterium TaxID=2609290 RepID=UPI0036714B7D